MIQDIHNYRDLLEAEYKDIKNKLSSLGKQVRGSDNNYDTVSSELNIDTSDRQEVASSIESFETRVAEEAELEKKLNQIIAATDAIINNTYGTCVICGVAIKEERLRANPSSITCVECSSIDSTSSTI